MKLSEQGSWSPGRIAVDIEAEFDQLEVFSFGRHSNRKSGPDQKMERSRHRHIAGQVGALPHLKGATLITERDVARRADIALSINHSAHHGLGLLTRQYL